MPVTGPSPNDMNQTMLHLSKVRRTTILLAALVGVIAVGSLVYLRSAPSPAKGGSQTVRGGPFSLVDHTGA